MTDAAQKLDAAQKTLSAMLGGFLDALGWFGAVVIVVAYFLLTRGDIGVTEGYHGAMITGCVLVGIAAAYRRNGSSVAVQVFMISIALWGIVQLRHPKPVPAPIPAAVIATKLEPASKTDPPKIKTVKAPRKPAGKPPVRFSCQEVREAVRQYGAELVEREARARGISERDIARGKKCLRG